MPLKEQPKRKPFFGGRESNAPSFWLGISFWRTRTIGPFRELAGFTYPQRVISINRRGSISYHMPLIHDLQ